MVVLSLPAESRAQAGSDQASRVALMRARPGDRVALHVFGEPTLSDNATVDERGRISLPRIGMLDASSMTVAALRDTVRSRMAAFLREPTVDVMVLRRVIINGEVARPGVYYVELTSTLTDAIAQAGGLRETANSKKVYLVRDGERRQLANWETDRSAESDLHSGDQIIVGRKSWLALNVIPVVSVATSVVALVISLRR